MTAMASVVASRRLVSEADMFFAVTLLAFCGCTMFFDLGGNLGAKALMLADTIVYGGASVANGIAEGWASRAACKGTDYSIETYRAHQLLGLTWVYLNGSLASSGATLIDITCPHTSLSKPEIVTCWCQKNRTKCASPTCTAEG